MNGKNCCNAFPLLGLNIRPVRRPACQAQRFQPPAAVPAVFTLDFHPFLAHK
jgi:hypothetical protein